MVTVTARVTVVVRVVVTDSNRVTRKGKITLIITVGAGVLFLLCSLMTSLNLGRQAFTPRQWMPCLQSSTSRVRVAFGDIV